MWKYSPDSPGLWWVHNDHGTSPVEVFENLYNGIMSFGILVIGSDETLSLQECYGWWKKCDVPVFSENDCEA